MAVPTRMSDLYLAAASNSPAGTDPIGNNLDDYLRGIQSVLRSTNAISTSGITAAATTDIASSDGEYAYVTGAAVITSLGTGFAGCFREVEFTGVCTISHSINLQLPGGGNITTAPADMYCFRCLAPGQWILVSGSRSNDPAKANVASPAFTGTATYNGIEVGFRGIPQTVNNAAYTFAATDAGKCRVKSDGNPWTYTVAAAIHAAGDVLTVMNSGSAGNVTIAGSGVTLQLSGTTTTGSRTVAPGGVVTIFFDSPTHAFVGGTGLS